MGVGKPLEWPLERGHLGSWAWSGADGQQQLSGSCKRHQTGPQGLLDPEKGLNARLRRPMCWAVFFLGKEQAPSHQTDLNSKEENISIWKDRGWKPISYFLIWQSLAYSSYSLDIMFFVTFFFFLLAFLIPTGGEIFGPYTLQGKEETPASDK